AGEVIVAGHSKGGNKAQLVAIFRDEVKICFSFNGQGFSAEALAAFKRDFPDFERRVSRIYSISCCNDPVSAMGDRLVSEQGRRYVSQYAADKPRDYHEMYTIIGEDLRIESSCERGQVSLAAERLWDAIRTSPDRALAVTAAMNASERYLGSGLPVNGEYISQRDEMRGEFVTARLVLKSAIESVKGLEKVRTRLSELKAIIGTVRTGQKKRITPHLFSSSRGERISVDTAELRSNAAGLAVQANAQISQINASDREIKVFERERTRLIAAANVLQGQAQDYESAEAAIARLARWTIN
ncbi:MAG: hypothetical protein RRY38_00490, partial [Oscillospiraceae bacterium]